MLGRGKAQLRLQAGRTDQCDAPIPKLLHLEAFAAPACPLPQGYPDLSAAHGQPVAVGDPRLYSHKLRCMPETSLSR